MVQGSHTTAFGCRDELSEWRCWMTFARDWEQAGVAGTGIFWGNNQPHHCKLLRHRTKIGSKAERRCGHIIFPVMIFAESAITQGFGE